MHWLFRLLTDEHDRRWIEAELAELAEVRRQEQGDRAAARWLRGQRLSYAWRAALDRRRAGGDRRTMMGQVMQDLRYGLRSLARAKLLVLIILATVGIGVGATTAMITVTRTVLVDALPYQNADGLYWIYTDNPPYRFRFSVVDYRALEADHPSFGSVAAYQTARVNVQIAGEVERVTAKSVTGSYFPLLGQRAYLGRLLSPADEAARDRVVVLTFAYWQRRFGSDASIVNHPVVVDGESHTVVGILQKDVGPLERDVALWTPARWPTPTRKGPFFTMALGRLAPGASTSTAAQALRATDARLFPIWRASYQDEKATWGLQDLKSRVLGDIGPTLMLVLAAVACVWLIACANALNLLIARALGRSRELAIRTALGASRGRLLQHGLVEAAWLMAGIAAVAAGVAVLAVRLVTAFSAAYIPRIDEVHLAATDWIWLVGLTAAAGVVIGLVPAVHGLRVPLDRALSAGGRSRTDAPATHRARRALVAGEFALATPLLALAALVASSLYQLQHVPVGFDPARVFTGAVALSGPRYEQAADRTAFWTRALERLAAVPGVQVAALADSRPPVESGNRNNFDLEDRPAPTGQNQPISTWVAVSPSFFKAIGLRLEEGRPLDDRSLQENVVVVDRAWANRFFPGERVVGRRLKEGGCTACPWTTVAGVVDDVKWTGLSSEPDGTVYSPIGQTPTAFVILRTAGDPVSLASGLRQAVRDLDPMLALASLSSGEELIDAALAAPAYLSALTTLLACASLVLSIVGVYGVMVYFVQQHTRDIGIRLALGGEPRRVFGHVLGRGLMPVAIGIVLGAIAAVLATRLAAATYPEANLSHPLALIAVPAGLLVVALVACVVPARRAAQLDPAEVLRES